MKKTLISLCIAALFPAFALAQATPAPAKPASPAKKAAPAAKKAPGTKVVESADGSAPKGRLLSKDQLRKCLALNDENGAENTAIGEEKAKFEADRDAILKVKDDLLKESEGLQTSAKEIVAEQEALKEERKAFDDPELGKKSMSKSEQAAFKAKADSYNQRATANGHRAEAYNVAKAEYNVKKTQFDPRIDANNAWAKKLQSRVDELGYAVEGWKAECANRPYMEADEIAIKKEKAK